MMASMISIDGLQPGDKCRLLVQHQKDYGKIVIFLNKSFNGNYLFQNAENSQEIIVCHDESQFIALPKKDQLKGVIDLCLDLGWEELFNVFSEQLINGEYND